MEISLYSAGEQESTHINGTLINSGLIVGRDGGVSLYTDYANPALIQVRNPGTIVENYSFQRAPNAISVIFFQELKKGETPPEEDEYTDAVSAWLESMGIEYLPSGVQLTTELFTGNKKSFSSSYRHEHFGKGTPITAVNVEHRAQFPGTQLLELVQIGGLVIPSNAQSLRLETKNITDISSIASLKDVEWLDLSSNSIVDISPLTELKKLNMLSLDFNKIRIDDFSPLSELKELQHLSLSYNGTLWDAPPLSLSELPLSELKGLTGLYLNGNNIEDISLLSELENLEHLYLTDNNIVDISPLSEIEWFLGLHLGNNNIEDISPLFELRGFKYLTLEGNPISDEKINELRTNFPNSSIN